MLISAVRPPAQRSERSTSAVEAPQPPTIQDQFLQSYDNAMASYVKTGMHHASCDSSPESQRQIRAAVQATLSALPSGATAQAVAAVTFQCLDAISKDQDPDDPYGPTPLAGGGAPRQAVMLAGLDTIENLPQQAHPHASTLARFGRQLAEELEPKEWLEKGYNLNNIYACDYSRSVAHNSLQEIRGLDDKKFNPALSEGVAKIVLKSRIYGEPQKIQALDKGFKLIQEDRNPRVYDQPFDRNKAYAGEKIDIRRQHAWIPFKTERDEQSTVHAKVALMVDILQDHGGSVKEPFHG